MKIRKAILTGGGRATRLYPVTATLNKHLLPLANKPMIFHAIDKAVEAGVTEIYINTNPGETELQKYVGDGGHWGITIKFFEQTGGPQGIAHVVNEAKKFIGNEPFMFYLSDNILLGSLKPMVDEFNQGGTDCMLALSRVPDPERFGIPYFDDAGALVDVVEKPSNPPNNLAVTGIYLYAGNVFFDAFDRIEKSPRGEYEISSIHSLFLKEKRRVGYTEITGWWKDTGKPEDLLICNALLLDGMDEQAFPRKGTVAPDAQISGNVHIGVGAQVGSGVRIQGPVIIGENCRLENCVIGPYATLGTGVEVRGATIENSLVLDNATITHGIHLRNSLIGKKAQIISRQPSDEQGGMMIVGEKTLVAL